MPTQEAQATRQFDREKAVYETQMRDLNTKKEAVTATVRNLEQQLQGGRNSGLQKLLDAKKAEVKNIDDTVAQLKARRENISIADYMPHTAPVTSDLRRSTMSHAEKAEIVKEKGWGYYNSLPM